MYHWTENLVKMEACEEAVEWARGCATYAEAWEACERADWLLWLAAKKAGPRGSASHRAVVLGAALCAETALRYLPEGEDRPARAVDLAVRYGRGENVEARELRAAADAAWAAAACAAADAYAADADAYAAAAWAAAADAYAAADADADAERRMADIVRAVVARPEL